MTVQAQAVTQPAPRQRRARESRGQVNDLLDVRAAWRSVLGPGSLPADWLDQLLLLSNPRDFLAGQPVMSHAEIARSVLLLVRGDVGLGTAVPSVPFHPERSVRGPAWLDCASVWLGATYAQDAVAFTDCRVVAVTRSAYETMLGRFPELALRTLIGLARQVFTLTEATHNLMHKDAQARLAAWLLERCGSEPGAPQSARVVLEERKRDIASQLAVTPETLSRLLRQFSSDGLIKVRGYTIAVLDVASLRARAQV